MPKRDLRDIFWDFHLIKSDKPKNILGYGLYEYIGEEKILEKKIQKIARGHLGKEPIFGRISTAIFWTLLRNEKWEIEKSLEIWHLWIHWWSFRVKTHNFQILTLSFFFYQYHFRKLMQRCFFCYTIIDFVPMTMLFWVKSKNKNLALVRIWPGLIGSSWATTSCTSLRRPSLLKMLPLETKT